ncbi:MAG: hypothetical protein BAJATHORv1_10006 [Candidatus Thorarchaeota archaeon]|nr:MAG: hypothetical protein BAJATHORv1_10006 [Candidatus Thorarchaeota archaeon]
MKSDCVTRKSIHTKQVSTESSLPEKIIAARYIIEELSSTDEIESELVI